MPNEHVTYLGAFLASGMLWRGDLYRDEQGYWAQHTFTAPSGDHVTLNSRIESTAPEAAVHEALLSAFEWSDRHGLDIASMTCIHSVPGMERASTAVIQAAPAPQYLQ